MNLFMQQIPLKLIGYSIKQPKQKKVPSSTYEKKARQNGTKNIEDELIKQKQDRKHQKNEKQILYIICGTFYWYCMIGGQNFRDHYYFT